MATYMDDQTRIAHYDKCRIKKKRNERVLDVCMWVAIICGAVTVIPTLFVNGLLNGIFIGDIPTFLRALLTTAIVLFSIYAIYLRKPVITAIAALASFFVDPLVFIATLVSIVPHIGLQKLSQEEGWPLFDISIREYQQREKNTEKIIQHRAMELGARRVTDSAEGDAEMNDILNDTSDTVLIPPAGYHDRFRDAVPEDRIHSFQPGVMDTLESIDENKQK
ncbi:MAG: hypothetical protein PUC41_03925 [Oscillospiraceae bacterium]|nr:hypothetical protein [Oscillospiraceae bacterium]